LLQYKEDGKLSKMESDFKKRVQKSVLRPKPVSGVSDAVAGDKTIVTYYTPTITLQHNIINQDGAILFYKGVSINPLNPQSVASVSPNAVVPQFNETLLFIDADKKAQVNVNFAKKEINTLLKPDPFLIFKIILTKGNLKTASNTFGRIYFDQDGVLCHLFGIKRVPAVVTRSGDRLKITEPAI
ncbi:MAG: hypothetical protein NTU49_00490, partial [Gammaproteobacteria bacterium]|nr:hypothetical protein [Gammaproteobacteria bacterium]